MAKEKIRLGVFGGAGRMGSALEEQISKHNAVELTALIDREAARDKQSGFVCLEELAGDSVDVIIDFSSPEGTALISKWCVKNGVSLVSGTTGLSAAESAELKEAGKKVPVLVSPNMSPGLNAMASAIAAFMKGFRTGEIAIEEIHHRLKKDKPSGTAILLEKTVKENLSPDLRLESTVSIRGGDVFGIHRVSFFADGEWVTFEHNATGRQVFARGAVEAAIWISGQNSGYYEMADMLKGLK